ncbi:hypothetical protein W04_1729 [Pseudoalteromonas sp. SW0106-04]|nr:hypothetical protein W04_1729 [Pseudoalteromonas sp. SW0106-04]
MTGVPVENKKAAIFAAFIIHKCLPNGYLVQLRHTLET